MKYKNIAIFILFSNASFADVNFVLPPEITVYIDSNGHVVSGQKIEFGYLVENPVLEVLLH